MAIKIFIDQGHNPIGPNTGAEGFGQREQDINYNIGTYLANILDLDPNFEVRKSRNTPDEILGTDRNSSLAERVRLANEWPADYFISIHANANVNPRVNGTEIYVPDETFVEYYLAEDIMDAIVNRLNTTNNQVRVNPYFYVLRNTNMPSLLIELAYLTNEEDAEKLTNAQYQFAFAIYEGLLSFFNLEMNEEIRKAVSESEGMSNILPLENTEENLEESNMSSPIMDDNTIT